MKATVRMMCAVSRLLARRAVGVLGGLLLCAVACLAQTPAADDLEGKIIADVLPQSLVNHTIEKEKIMGLIKTRPGAKFSQATLQDDVRALGATRAFVNVQPWVVPTADGKVVVHLRLTEYPSVVRDIVYKGRKHFKTEDLDNATGLRKGMPMNPAANRQACHALVQLYHDKGRMLAHVDLLEGAKSTDTRVVFNITEGPIAKVRSISFTGNTFVTNARLQTQVQTSKQLLGLFGGTYNPAMTEGDVLKLKEYYRSFGYHDIDVSREVVWDPDQQHVHVVFHVHEGQRYKVASVSVHGNKIMKEDEIIRFVKLKPGEVFNQQVVDSDEERIKALYGYTGRGVTDRANLFYPQDKPGQVDVHYEIQERPVARVGQMIIVGNEVTRQNVILRQIGLYPGQILTYPDLRRAETNLARLNIFESKPEQGVRPTVTVLDPDSDNEYKDLLITVQETQTGSLLFGLGVNSDAGLSGSVVLNERNFDILKPPTSFEDLLSGRAFRGAGQEFRMEAVPGTQLQRYTVSWREPFLFDSPYSLGTSGYYYTRIFNEYAEQRLGGRVNGGRKLGQYWNVTSALRVENVGVHDVPFFAPSDFQSVVGNNFLLGLRGGINRDTRDSYLRPTDGSIIDLSYEQVLGEFDFPVASLDINKYFTTYQRPDGSGRHVLAARSMVSIAGANAPVYERLYAGGFRTMRGFQFRGVGPDVNGFKVGGDFLFLNSLEYQVPVRANDQMYLVGFVDSGTVESSVEIRDYRVSAGVGVRVVVPMLGPMPIALDFGFPIVRKSTDLDQIFSFWVGFFH